MRWEQRVPRPSQRNKEAWRGVAVRGTGERGRIGPFHATNRVATVPTRPRSLRFYPSTPCVARTLLVARRPKYFGNGFDLFFLISFLCVYCMSSYLRYFKTGVR
jgi:hypothetical protein